MQKFVVMTSIFSPTFAVQKFAELVDWQVIVVGDAKSPADWQCPNVIYLDLEQQAALGYALHDLLPLNHYARKNLGYLHAIQQGADLIADLDDDNIPYDHWGQAIPLPELNSLPTVSAPKFANIYRLFTNACIWPRGFPLDAVADGCNLAVGKAQPQRLGVCQFLADRDPDVDAIYRLLYKDEVYFEPRGLVGLERGVYAPFNSQNTLWFKESFPFMFLPAYVTFRFTDILRGYVAQRGLWSIGRHLAFGPATVYQERNPHSHMADFRSEIPMYLSTRSVVEALDSVSDESPPASMLRGCYDALLKDHIIEPRDMNALEAWLSDIDQLGI